MKTREFIFFIFFFLLILPLVGQGPHALHFDGNNDFAQKKSPLLGNIDFTIEVWFTNEQPGNVVQADILAWGEINVNPRFYISDQQAELAIFDEAFNASSYIKPFPGTNIRGGIWHHLAVTKSGNLIQVFLDNLTFTYNTAGNAPFDLTSPMRIGRRLNFFGNSWGGKLDEIRIWDHARTIDQIKDFKTCELSGSESGLLAYYKMNQGTAGGNNSGLNTIIDYTGNGFDANMSNFSLNGNTSNWVDAGAPVFYIPEIITFEELNLMEGDELFDQYDGNCPCGVRFYLGDPMNNIHPVLAEVGGAQSAFTGVNRSEPDCGINNSTQADMPAPNQNVGCKFLTDDLNVGPNPPNVNIVYNSPTEQASGYLLDIDGTERWQITAYLNNVQVAQTFLCSSAYDGTCSNVINPVNPADNGLASYWEFDLPGTPFNRIEFDHTGGGINIGLAFDNFSACRLQRDTTCMAAFEYTLNDCGEVSFVNQSTGSGQATYLWEFGEGSTSTDPNPTFNYAQNGTYTVCLTITDATCTDKLCQDIQIIVDNQPPVINCIPPIIPIPTDLDECTAQVMLNIQANDNCLFSLTCTRSDGLPCTDPFPKGTTTVTYTAVDEAGNTDQCQFPVVVEDQQDPVIFCQDIMAQAPPGEDGIFVDYPPANAMDNCPMLAVICNPPSGSFFPCGETRVACIAIDMAGNEVECRFDVFVQCEPLPKIDTMCGKAVLTCYSGNRDIGSEANGIVLAIEDIRDRSAYTPGSANAPQNFPSYSHPSWTAGNIGEIFGIAIDDQQKIYVSATTIYPCNFNCLNPNLNPEQPPYFGPAVNTGGEVYVLDLITYVPQLLVRLPNSGQGLGNLCFVKGTTRDWLLITNFEDGRIYPFDLTNNSLGVPYDPFPGNPDDPSQSFTQLGRRSWGIGYNALEGRAYFGVWSQHSGGTCWSTGGATNGAGANLVYSVVFDPNTGSFSGSPIIELDANLLTQIYQNNNIQANNPISDIAFSNRGNMLVSEKTMCSDDNPGAHNARVMEFAGGTGNWSTNINYVIGTGTGRNSSGGTDYGYDSFDPKADPMPVTCDEMVWATCDIYNMPTNNGNVSIYGFTGGPASGNNLSNSYFHRVPGGAILKRALGDFEVFRCGCPDISGTSCDSLFVHLYADPEQPCCYFVDSENFYSNDIKKLKVEILTPGVIFNTSSISVLSGFQWAPGNSNREISITNPSGFPLGYTNSVLRFCYAGVDDPSEVPQDLKFTWYEEVNGILVETKCTQLASTRCPITPDPDPCLHITPRRVDCDPTTPGQYQLTFYVDNLSQNPGFDAYNVDLFGLPPGWNFANCTNPSCGIPIPNAPLNSGFPSTAMKVDIIAQNPVIQPTQVCLSGKLIGIEDCCSTETQFCFTVEPCCDPCEDISLNARYLQTDSVCCVSLDLFNDCQIPFFSKITAKILTPGVTYGYYALGGNYVGLWSLAGSTNSELCLKPSVATIPQGNYPGLIDFCLSNVNNQTQLPQEVLISYWTPGVNGKDSLTTCDTLLYFDCPVRPDFHCLEISDLTISCLENQGKYQLDFTVTNKSQLNFLATHLDLIKLSPGDLDFFPSTSYQFTNPLNYNDSEQVSICLTDSDGLPGSGPLTFIPKLRFQLEDTCCYEGDPVIVPLPPCESCCIGEDAFMDRVEQGFTWSASDCNKVTVTPNALIDCDSVSWNWGDGSFDSWFGYNESVMHTYANSGWYEVTMLVFEWDHSVSPPRFCYEWYATDSIFIDCNDYFKCDSVSVESFFSGQGDDCCITLTLGNQHTQGQATGFLISNMQGASITGGNPPAGWSVAPAGSGLLYLPPGGIIPPGTFSLEICLTVTASVQTFETSWLFAVPGNPDPLIACTQSHTWDCPFSPLCACGSFSDLKIENSNQQFNISCRETGLLSCPVGGILLTGLFECDGPCVPGRKIKYQFKPPLGGGPVKTGGFVSPNSMEPLPFQFPFPDSWFTIPGVYEITMTARCGDKFCTCIVLLEVPDCGMDGCTCPIDDLEGEDILITNLLNSCKFQFSYPALTDCDRVTWELSDGQSGTFPGNVPFVLKLQNNTIYTIKMQVVRTTANGEICRATVWKKFKTKCGLPAVIDCANGIDLENPDFSNGLDPWRILRGTVKFESGLSCDDDGGAVWMTGNKRQPAEIIQTIGLDYDPALNFEVSFCILGSELLLPGTQVVVETDHPWRNEPFEVGRILLDSIGDDTIFPPQDAMYTKYLFNSLRIKVENELTDTSFLSKVGIDNICIQPIPSISKMVEVPKELEVYLYPNPTGGGITIMFPQAREKELVLQLIDLDGKIRYSEVLRKGSFSARFEMENSPPGVYILKITEENGIQTYKKVVKH